MPSRVGSRTPSRSLAAQTAAAVQPLDRAERGFLSGRAEGRSGIGRARLEPPRML
jgi:hypothetical protein